MIVSSKTSWLGILLKFRGTALQRVWKRIAFVTLVAVVVTYLDLVVFPKNPFHDDLTSTPFSLIGLALSIFLGFRNNTSYDRFWEGRKLWGRLVNTSRSLTRQTLTLVRPSGEVEVDEEELKAFHEEMVHRLAAYVHCFRLHLREKKKYKELSHLLAQEEIDALADETNPPVATLQTLGDRYREAWDKGWIDRMHLPVLEDSLTQLTDIQGGCERIKSTPIPFSYTALIHRIVALYCFGLPFGLVTSLEEFTPVVVAAIS